ncbi:MAG: GntR family transcriptional regulator [Pseudomonadota bacterium]|nr:GntR family transcriptional regulator [Pseudomonadota bacterium]
MRRVAPPRAAKRASKAASSAPRALQRDSVEPLYRQLAAYVQRQIDSGALAPGAPLASETALMAQFDVSRVTVRQAMALLQQHGKVVARRGKGRFVAGRVVQHDLDSLQGFYDALRQQGIEPQTTLLEFSADAGALDDLAPPGCDLPVRLQRLYAVDALPFALVVGYLPREAAALGEARAARLTVYQILQEYLGLRIARAEVTIRSQRPPRVVARHLGLRAADETLVMERKSFAHAAAACEFMRIYIVSERYEFRLRVAGPLEIARSVHRVSEAKPPPSRGTDRKR